VCVKLNAAPWGCVKVSGLPQHPYQYRALLCQMFGAYGKGKALHFEGSRYGNLLKRLMFHLLKRSTKTHSFYAIYRCYIEYERTRPSHKSTAVGDSQNVIPAVYMAVKAG